VGTEGAVVSVTTKLVSATTVSNTMSYVLPVEFSPSWSRPIGAVPIDSVLLNASTRASSNQVSIWLDEPLIKSLTWTSCQTPVVTAVELFVLTDPTSLR
jgi:hypothetical protein